MNLDPNTEIKSNGFRSIRPGIIAALIGIFAIGLSQWRTLPALAQPPTSTQECVVRALNQILRNGGNASLADVQKICGISGPAPAVRESKPSSAARNTASLPLAPDRLDSATHPKTEPGGNSAPVPPSVSAQSGPTNQPNSSYLAGGHTVVVHTGPGPVTRKSITGIVNAKDWGASGSDNAYTCSIDAGSTTLTCTKPTDFQVGQYIGVPTGGAPSPLIPVSTITAAQLGTRGSTQIEWALCTADPMGGISGCATSAISNGTSTLSTANPASLTFTRNNVNAALHLIYRKTGSGRWAFITVTNKSPWYDIGYTPTSFFGWPTTPTPQNQTLYAQVIGGSGSTWTLDTAVSNSATAVTVMHDDTPAVQEAANSCAMKGLYFPPGTYHLNRPQFFNFTTQQFYSTFTTATPNYPGLYAQGLVQIPSNCSVAGAGPDVTFLVTDRMGNSSGNENLFGLNTGSHNNPFNIKPAALTYALNNAAQGTSVVETTNAADASNFSRGDYVLTYGGAAIASPYVSNEINQVVSANSATGAIVLSNPLQKPLPYGNVGTPPAIIKLNGNIIHDDDFSDMTINTPSGIWFNTSAVYHVHTQRIDQPVYAVSDLWYGGFRRDWTNEDNNFVSQGQELDMDEDFAFRGGSWLTFGNGINFDETSSTGIFDKTIIAYGELLCSTGVTCSPGTNVGVAIGSQLNVFNFAITNSTIGSTCNSANNLEPAGFAISQQGGVFSGAPGQNDVIRNNVINTNCRGVFQTNSPSMMELSFDHNTITHRIAAAQPFTGLRINGGGRIENNTYTLIEPTGAPDGYSAIQVLPNSTTPMPADAMYNTINIGGATPAHTCVTVSDPGSIVDASILIGQNTCTNTAIGYTVSNPAHTPNVVFIGALPVSKGRPN
jgi:hypothetical protein